MSNVRDRIKVVCRIRPENAIERAGNYQRCVEYDQYNISIECQPESKEVAAPVVRGVIDGFNGTIFAYGQTGSGKSFTMEGVRGNQELQGLIPRMFDFLFDLIRQSDSDLEFHIKCSYLEIYMEKIMDLLDAKKTNLQVKEDKIKGLYIQDATEVSVSSTDEMMDVMNAGSQNRSVAATRMNATSSRSHSIFLVQVFQKNTKTGSEKQSKLFCCDLAGSEKVEKTEAKGSTLEEAKMINKSLSALGNVINALTESSKKNVFIPYRDSKLTRILQESLGGNSSTCLVITCSLSRYNDRETLSTLRFGNRAKSIKNAVKCNAQRSAKELQILLTACEGKLSNKIQCIKQIQTRMKDAFEGEESRGDLDSIQNLIMWIYQTEDVEKLQQMLNLAMTSSAGNELVAPVESKKASNDNAKTASAARESEKKDDTTADMSNSVATPVNSSNQAGNFQVALLNQRIEELQKDKTKLEDEKKLQDEEITQLNQEIYKLNDKILQMQVNGASSPIKTSGIEENSKDLSYSLTHEKVESEAMQRYFELKDANIKRQLDLKKLRAKLENLQQDFKIYQTSNKIKLQNIQPLSSPIQDFDQDHRVDSSTRCAESGLDFTIDSDQMITDQIVSSLELIKQIQSVLSDDILNAAFTNRKTKENPQFKKSSTIVSQRRRSQGHVTLSKMISMAQNDNGMGIVSQLAQLNESDNAAQVSHTQQIINLPSFKNVKNGNKDETMLTEMEYVNIMKDNNFRASVFQQDESFFRSIVKLDKGETGLVDDKTADYQALLEVNEQHIKKIQELQRQVSELEEENNALEQEHLVLLKKQIQNNGTVSSDKEQSTMADSKSQIVQEDQLKVVANKDQQIEMLSNMLEQKGNFLRKTKDELDEAQNSIKEKDVQIEKNTLENQDLKVRLQKLINSDNSAKAAYNADMLMDQNKLLKNRIEQMHKQSVAKDNEITHLQGRQADYEKRIVLLQQQAKDNKLLQKLHQENGINQAHIKSLMMPFSSSTNMMNRSNFGTQGGFGKFYNQQVYKPIRGGGGAPNPAGGSSQTLNFSEFMDQQTLNSYSTNKKRNETVKSQPNLNSSNRFRSVSKTHQLVSKKDMKKQNLMQSIPGFGSSQRDSRLDVRSAVRPSKGGDLNMLNALKMKGSTLNLQNQEQMLKMKKQEEASMHKAKKFYVQQKIVDGRLQAARQMMHEESHETDQTYDEDESHFNRQNRFGQKQQHVSGRNSVLQDVDVDANDTYQDIDDDGSDNDQMESRAEYNSEDDEGVDSQYRNVRDQRMHPQSSGARTHNAGKRTRQFSERDINLNMHNTTSNSYQHHAEGKTEDKKKKTLTSKLFGGMTKMLKN